ncbi:ABC transporter permease [Paenibacillus sp. PL2-23]|uniref:ABC transporter permease n=1 Tax=Paenibacillus sp. PL2-23 TaxID=2100729 RepID=UPI0030F7AF42
MAAKQFASMFTAQVKMMFRDKQVWFWNLFFPIILMVLFMVIFGGGGSSPFKATIAVADPSPNASSSALLGQLQQIPVFEVKSGGTVSIQQGKDWIQSEEVDALIVLPEQEGVSEVGLIVNRANEGGASTQAVSSILNTLIQQANLAAAGATATYTVSMESISTAADDVQYEDFLLTGMIGLAVAQGGLFGMVEIVDMRKRGLLKRLRMTPARMGLFGLASMIVRLMLGVIQIFCLTLVGVFAFGATLHVNLFSLLIAFIVGALAFSAMGYLFSSFSKTMEAYMGMANIASMLMMFLSGVFFPVNTLPDWLQIVPQLLPLTYFVDGMRDGLIYANGVLSGSFWMGVAIMSTWGIVSYLIGSIVYKSKSNAATR